MGPIASIRTPSRSPLLQVLKTSVAAILAWVLSALLLQQPLPIFAAIAALLVVQPSVNQSLSKGIERSIGVILGVVLAFGAGLVFGNASWVVLAIIVVALLVAWALKLTPGSSNQIPISAMLVLAIGTQTPAYALDRILETIIGAIVGLIVNVIIVPPVLVAPARLSVGRLAAGTAGCLERLATALRTPQRPADLTELLNHARELRPLRAKADEDLDSAEESLTFNPRALRHRRAMTQDRELLSRLSILVTRTLGMTRAVHDNYDPALSGDAVVSAIATELDRAAHDVRLMAKSVGATGPVRRVTRRSSAAARRYSSDALVSGASGDFRQPETGELPALTAPLVIAKPDPRHWILVGSLMEDLRRIRQEIKGTEDD